MVGIFRDLIFREPMAAASWVDKKIPSYRVNIDQSKTIGLRKILSDSKTPYIIVSLWATWCEPCKQELPTIHGQLESMEKKGVSFILVNADGPFPEKSIPAAELWLAERGLRFTQYYDFKDQIISALNIVAIPFHIGLKKDGTVVWVEQGELDVGDAVSKFL